MSEPASEPSTRSVVTYEVVEGIAWLTIDRPEARNEILLTGEPVTARRAREVGLVNHVVQTADLRHHTQTLAARIGANAPLSVLAAKRTAYLSAQHPRDEAYTRAEEVWEPVYLSADAQEGPAAFRAKRSPVWKGR